MRAVLKPNEYGCSPDVVLTNMGIAPPKTTQWQIGRLLQLQGSCERKGLEAQGAAVLDLDRGNIGEDREDRGGFWGGWIVSGDWDGRPWGQSRAREGTPERV